MHMFTVTKGVCKNGTEEQLIHNIHSSMPEDARIFKQ